MAVAEISCQRLTGIRLLVSRYLLRSSLRHNPAAIFSALRSKINDPIRIPDYVQIMFNDDDRIPQVGQSVQHIQQFLYVVKMQPSGWLIQQVKRLSSLSLA